MSVVLDKPIVTERQQTLDAPAFLRQREPLRRPQPTVEPAWTPVAVPVTVPTSPVKVRRKSQVGVGQLLLAKSMMFVAVFGVTFVASSLAGHCLAERSRVQNEAALKRANYAIRQERGTLERLHTIQGAATVERWAFRNRFHPADGLGETSNPQDLVAASR